MLLDSGGDANDMGVGFRGTMSYTWKKTLKKQVW